MKAFYLCQVHSHAESQYRRVVEILLVGTGRYWKVLEGTGRSRLHGLATLKGKIYSKDIECPQAVNSGLVFTPIQVTDG